WLRHQQDREASGEDGNSVEVGLTGEDGFPRRGRLDFIDNALDPATGTIRARAVLSNPDGRLTPGLSARVRLPGNSARDALLIHDQAVLTDQDRKYVWVVGEGNVAMRKDIVPGEAVDGLREVRSGLAAGDRVLVNGVRKIFFPGQPVAPREVPMDAPGTPAASAPDASAA